MKLELKHLAPYLPYGLKCRLSHDGMQNLDAEYPNEHQHKVGVIKHFSFYEDEMSGSFWVTDKYSFDFDELSGVEIILRPISDLIPVEDDDVNDFVLISLVNGTDQHCDAYDEWRDSYLDNPEPDRILQAPYEVFQELIKQHYDVFGLIPAGLAIDINTLKP